MQRRCCGADCTRSSRTATRVLACVDLLAALCLLIFGSTVERPINSFPPVAMILLAVLAIATSATGLAGGGRCACCLDGHLALRALLTACEVALCAVLLAAFGTVVDAIDPHHTGRYDRAHVTQVLRGAQVLLPVFTACSVAALVLSLLLRFVLPSESAMADAFDVENMQARAHSAQALRGDVEGARWSTTRNSVYGKLRSKLAKKYGALAHGVKFSPRSWLPFL